MDDMMKDEDQEMPKGANMKNQECQDMNVGVIGDWGPGMRNWVAEVLKRAGAEKVYHHSYFHFGPKPDCVIMPHNYEMDRHEKYVFVECRQPGRLPILDWYKVIPRVDFETRIDPPETEHINDSCLRGLMYLYGDVEQIPRDILIMLFYELLGAEVNDWSMNMYDRRQRCIILRNR